MGSFWTDNAPTNTGVTGGSLGGYKPAPTTAAPNGAPPGYIPPGVLYGGGASDPRTPAGFQLGQGVPETSEGPGGMSGQGGSYGFDPRLTTQPQPYQQGPTSGGSPGGPIDFNDPTGIASAPESHNQWSTIGERNRALYGPGSPLGGANGMTDFGPSSWSFAPSGGGPGTLQGPTMSSVFGGGIARGPNGGFINPATGDPYQGGTSTMSQVMGGLQQPMNPGQQNQTLMQSPDGQHFQYVNQEHVPHYQGLGATIHNGSSYGGGGS